MYSSFFNLRQKPFQLTPDPDFLYLSRGHRRALTYLTYGVGEHVGFITVTGEVGMGKTTLVRGLMKRLGDDVNIARVNNTKVSAEQLISMINDDFGIETKGRDKTQLVGDLTDFLIRAFAQRKRSTLIIDEAQNLTADLLEEIRLLSNLETDKSKLLQIILVGQPELRVTLSYPELRQLRQRISISCHLHPLVRSETEEYIYHRLEVAGNRNAVTFEEGTIDAIHGFSRGIPRLINIACDFMMLSAFAEQSGSVSLDLAKEVISDLESDNRYWHDEPHKNPLPSDSVLREIIDRLIKVETFVQRREVSLSERREMLDRLSVLEKQVTALAQRRLPLHEDSDTGIGNGRLKALLADVDALGRRLEDLEQREQSESRNDHGRKRTLWERIFN